MTDPTQPTERAFPNISVRSVHEGRIGVTISGAEYSLTPLDAYQLQVALEWALKEVSATLSWRAHDRECERAAVALLNERARRA